MTESKPVKVSLHPLKHRISTPTPSPDKKPHLQDDPGSGAGAHIKADSDKHVAKPGESPPPALRPQDFTRKNGTLEHGQICFLYRPKVQLEAAHSLEDVQRFFMLLLPKDSDSAPTCSWRLMNIGRKHLPGHNDPKMGEKGRPETIWRLFVAVGSEMSALRDSLGPKEYETKTRGTRKVGAARVAGTGSYLLHSTRDPTAPKDSKNMSAVYKTRLAYALALPHELGHVQGELNLHDEGAFQVQIKNPETKSTNPRVRDQPENRRPKYPDELAQYFTTRWIPANPAALLNYPGCEVLLVPGRHSVLDEIGEEVEKCMLEEAEHVVANANASATVKDETRHEDQDEDKSEGEHAQVMAILRQLGLDGLVDGGALEGHWE